MGIKSTYTIDRIIAHSIIRSKIHNLSDIAIENILEHFIESEYRNYKIVDEWQMAEIHSIKDFETL